MPLLVSETAALRKRNDFAVVSVVIDKEEKLADAYQMAQRFKMNFPLVWEKEWSPPWGNQELEYRGVPSGFIIDPQGRVMRNIYTGEGIGKQMECLLDNVEQLPCAKMTWTHEWTATGTIRFTLQVLNPDRTPLELHLSADKLIWVYSEEQNGQWTTINPVPPGKHPNANTLKEVQGLEDVVRQLTFDKTDRASIVLDVPIDADAYDIDVCAKFMVPGTRSYERTGRDGQLVKGIWLTEAERVAVRKPDWR